MEKRRDEERREEERRRERRKEEKRDEKASRLAQTSGESKKEKALSDLWTFMLNSFALNVPLSSPSCWYRVAI